MLLKVLLRTTRLQLAQLLTDRLAPSDFRVVAETSDVPALDQVLDHCPDIFIFELAPSESPQSVFIQGAKKVNPCLKVIFLSQQSTFEDARIVEQGLFYYAVRPAIDEVIQVVEAAADAIRRERKRQSNWHPTNGTSAHERRSAL